MSPRKRTLSSTNNNQYPPSKKGSFKAIFSTEDYLDLGVQVLSDDESPELYNDYDRKIAEEFEEDKKLKPLPAETFDYRDYSSPIKDESDSFDCKVNPFNDLPDELVLVVFKYLSIKSKISLSQTCQRFRRLCKDESLWPKLNLTLRKLGTNSIGYVLMLGVRVLRLNSVTFFQPILSEQMSTQLENFVSKVKYLDLSYAWIREEELALLLSKMKHLVKLSLESLRVNRDVIEQVVKNGELDTLNLTMATGLDTECISMLAQHLVNIESLNLGWTNMNQSSYRELSLHLSPSIRHLDISGAQFAFKYEDFVSMIERCRFIETLDISDCLSLSAPAFLKLVATLTELKTLCVSRCYQIDLSTLLKVKNLPQLENLSAYRLIKEEVSAEFQARLPHVKIDKNPMSVVARPTVGIRRTSIWGHPTT